MLSLILAACMAAPAAAQPELMTAAPSETPSNPSAWWENPERRIEDRFNPLGRRRWNRNDRPLELERAPDASLYRLWGLTPLQTQAIRRDDTVIEAWVRPTAQRPEAVVRLTVRGDGRVFAQGRAGFACCRPDISRRVDVDVELPRERRDAVLALASDPLWGQPEHVVAQEAGAVSSLCVDGISYDLYLARNGRGLHRRRSCDDAEVGSAAVVLEAAFAAVRGVEPRFDAAVPQNGNFQAQQAYYAQFTATGGALAPAPAAPQSDTPPPPDEAAASPREAAVTEILAADFAFAERAGSQGLGQAAGDALDPADGLAFRMGADPARGRAAVFEAYGGGLPQAGRWAWGPVAAFASEEGDFGSSWGRWTFTPTGGAPSGGRYLTVWRRDDRGQWRGLMHMRDADPAATEASAAESPPQRRSVFGR